MDHCVHSWPNVEKMKTTFKILKELKYTNLNNKSIMQSIVEVNIKNVTSK